MLWDYDLDGELEVHAIAKLKDCIAKCEPLHWQIRHTKHGFHLLMRYETWDEVQEDLYRLKELTGKVSIMSCRKQRLRISPKWDLDKGLETSPVPVVMESCGHDSEFDIEHNRNLARLEFYKTYDHAVSTRQWTADELVLKSRGGEQIG